MYTGRKGRQLTPQKEAFARSQADTGLAEQVGKDLSKAVGLIRPATLIGAAAQGGAFSEGVVRALNQVTRFSKLVTRAYAMLHYLLSSE